MEINRNGRGCPRETLPNTTKTIKQKQPKQAKTLANLMEIKGNGRGCPKGPYHKPPKTLSKHNQNHQTQANLMEIEGNGTERPSVALAKTTETTNISKSDGNQQNHQQPPNLIEIKKGMVGDAPLTKKPLNTIKRK
jgi:hypothetical protein